MANSNSERTTVGVQYTASDVARLRNGSEIPNAQQSSGGILRRTLSREQTDRLWRADHDAFTRKVVLSIVALLVLSFFSLCFMGAAGQDYPYAGAYRIYSPAEVANVLGELIYNTVATATGLFSAHSNDWILANVPGYWAVQERAGVIGITLICAILLSVSGMLYQNAFKNPLAGPGMLGVSSGVSLGLMVLVYVFGAAASSQLGLRYLLCYGFGAAILAFVMLAGRRLSGRDKPFDVTTMLLIGSILSQLLGFVVSYVTLFLMDENDYLSYYTLSQMLTVDTSAISWLALGIASAVSLIPVIILRYKFNVLSFEPEEARMLGVSYGKVRVVALVCGAIMILAAQIHVGMVSLVSLIVPFLARSIFGCETSKQLVGNFCIGTILLLACRDITDLIPFVGDGLALGSVASVCMLPLFVVVMARQMRGWE